MGLAQGMSTYDVASEIGCNQSTVVRLSQKMRKNGHMENETKQGRPRKTSTRDDRKLVRNSLSNRKATAVELQTTWNVKPLASVRTVRRRLIEAQLPARIARKKPYLTESHKQARLAWAKEHESWTVEDWKSVLWSDESPFTLFPRCGKVYVRRHPGEEYKRRMSCPDGEARRWQNAANF
jgi:transposase